MRTLATAIACLVTLDCFAAAYDDWKHTRSVFLLTTPDGADLPPEATVREFPVLVRLHADFVPFAEADPTGLGTIYGRMLWRARQARITHGIRGIIWHPGAERSGCGRADRGLEA